MHKDSVLFDHFRNHFFGYYSFRDEEIEIYQNNSHRNDTTHLKVVKTNGHQTRKNGPKDFSDHSAVETHYLLDSLAFPTTFQAILHQEFSELNRLKRAIYDFVNRVAKPNLLAVFSFAINNHKYVKLKQDLTRVLIRSKRFENEFTKRNIQQFTRHFNLHEFSPKERNVQDGDKNFLIATVNDLSTQLKTLDSRVKSTNEIFKHLEELNTYKTNYRLQIASIIIAILAFIFTFDKVKVMFKSILEYLTNL